MGRYTLQARPDVTYEDRFFDQWQPAGDYKSHTLLGARINLVLPDQRNTLTVYGTNLTNDHYFTSKFPQDSRGRRDPLPGLPRKAHGRRREAGGQVLGGVQ